MPRPSTLQRQRALTSCRVIEALYADRLEESGVFSQLERVWGDVQDPTSWRQEFGMPAMIAFDAPDGLVVIASGLGSNLNWIAAAEASTGRANEFQSLIVNPFFLDAAQGIASRLADAGYEEDREVFFHGHSFGGAALLILAMVMKMTAEDLPIEVQTFGQPQIGPGSNVEFLAGINVIRWMTARDFVCLVPAGRLDVSSFGVAQHVPPTDLLRQVYIQMPMGWRLTEAGSMNSALYPSGTLQTGSGTLQALQAVTTASFANHYIPIYARCLLATLHGYELGMDPEVEIELPPPSPSRLWKLEDSPSHTIPIMQSASRITTEVKRMFMKIPSNYRPKPQQLGPSSWCVVWVDQVVATMKTRSQAHVYCKRLLAYLRYLSACSQFELDSFVNAQYTYLTAAAGGGGFIPPLNLTM